MSAVPPPGQPPGQDFVSPEISQSVPWETDARVPLDPRVPLEAEERPSPGGQTVPGPDGRVHITAPGQTPSSSRRGRPPTQPGRRFGRYELLEPLGAGGFGAVYRARDPQLEREVAVKVLERLSERARTRFAREVRLAARLRHPNIVGVHDAGECEDRPYLVMDLVRGQTLAMLSAPSGLEPTKAALLIRDVARAVHHAHEKGILHRDLKPHNVIVDEHGTPLVLDFGLAALEEDAGGRTGVAGTPAYMSPEQSGERGVSVGRHSDVWGLGATLFHTLTGRPPFVGSNPEQLLLAVLRQQPPRPSSLVPGIPRDLDELVLRCLRKPPAERPASAAALADDLDRFLSRRAPRAADVRASLGSAAVRGAFATLGALGVALVGALLAWIALRPSTPRDPTPGTPVVPGSGEAPATPPSVLAGKLSGPPDVAVLCEGDRTLVELELLASGAPRATRKSALPFSGPYEAILVETPPELGLGSRVLAIVARGDRPASGVQGGLFVRAYRPDGSFLEVAQPLPLVAGAENGASRVAARIETGPVPRLELLVAHEQARRVVAWRVAVTPGGEALALGRGPLLHTDCLPSEVVPQGDGGVVVLGTLLVAPAPVRPDSPPGAVARADQFSAQGEPRTSQEVITGGSPRVVRLGADGRAWAALGAAPWGVVLDMEHANPFPPRVLELPWIGVGRGAVWQGPGPPFLVVARAGGVSIFAPGIARPFREVELAEASARLAGLTLADGRLLATDAGNGRLVELLDPQGEARFAAPLLEGLARPGVVVAPERVPTTPPGAGWPERWVEFAGPTFSVFDGSGAQMLGKGNVITTKSPLQVRSPAFVIQDALLAELDDTPGPDVAIAFRHEEESPAGLALFGLDGRELARTWNRGWFTRVAARDTDGDGRAELFAAGMSNPLKRNVVAKYEVKRVAGQLELELVWLVALSPTDAAGDNMAQHLYLTDQDLMCIDRRGDVFAVALADGATRWPRGRLPGQLELVLRGQPGEVVEVSAAGTAWPGGTTKLDAQGAGGMTLPLTDPAAHEVYAQARGFSSEQAGVRVPLVVEGRVLPIPVVTLPAPPR